MSKVEFMGAVGSPYTRKMLALLRYRHIPHQVHWSAGRQPPRPDYPQPKVGLLPTFYLPDEAGTLQAVTDSTPLIRRFEAEYQGRSALPTDPVLGFLNELIEDYGDEWVTKAMFHYRWAFERDAAQAGPLLMFWAENTAAPEPARQMAEAFAERQIGRLYVVGSNDVTAPIIEASYVRLLKLLDTLIQQGGYVFGARPSSADYALYGQLTQLVLVEPTSMEIAVQTAPRIRAWVERMDDLSGLDPQDSDWMTVDQAGEALQPLLSEIGRTYVPAMLANAKAIMAGAKSFDTEIDGKPWTQPSFPYQAKCLGWLRESHAALPEDARSTVDGILAGTGCDALFA